MYNHSIKSFRLMKSALAGLKLHLFVLHIENCVDIRVDADVVELKIFHR